ncbi:MAG: GlxA family transcriptional regulator [Gammaproteobacteria bacterium]|nr:GlxA family transcriptional regulator [Gammaproteobacteria bacterium]MDH3536198.1 GlxA family transcriptional regulator [Gammaproteobacteria bacterium]
MDIFAPSDEKLRITLLVLPESSMMSMASALDTMRAANRIASRELFEWQIATLNGNPARLTCDLTIEPDAILDADSSGDVLIVIASFNQQHHAGPAHLKLIKRVSRNFSAVGGIEAGSWILARSGLLERRSATTHWEDLEEFANRFPAVNCKPDRFVIDGKVFTTGGASPTFDFMLYLIRKRYGYPLAIEVSSAFIYDGVHSATDTQPLVSLGMLENSEPRVAAAIHVMEQYIDEPIPTARVARKVNLSIRMLEYLFRQTLNMSPAAYYRRLRLQTARRMVVDTRLRLQEIAIRTGFNSLSSFSRLFRNHYQQTPGECRKQAQAFTR